jgi:hypothetical protein
MSGDSSYAEFSRIAFPRHPRARHQNAPLSPAPSTPLPDDVARKREQLLAAIARSELGGVEQRVAYMLQQFPETRDSYLALCIRSWRRFNTDVLERFNIVELDFLFELQNSETIGRLWREIQNTLQLFTGLDYTAQFRLLHRRKLEEYLATHKGVVPEIRFYLDETGNEGNKAYTGVAGVCVMNWRQYEMHEAALSQWRLQQGPEPIHFVEIGSDRTARAWAVDRTSTSSLGPAFPRVCATVAWVDARGDVFADCPTSQELSPSHERQRLPK